MSITLLPGRPLDVRLVGALIGAALGLGVVAAGLVFADGDARAATVMLGSMVLFVAAPLGWLFARRAIRPGLGSALTTPLMITLIAVPLGALVYAFLFAIGPGTLDPGEVLVFVPVLAGIGLLVLGLPLAGLTFVVASVWLGVLRLVIFGVRGGLRSFAAGASDDAIPLEGPTD